MPQSFTPVVPVTNADAAANLAPQMPLGSETRIIAGTYSMVQKLLNMAAAVNLWWSGGSLGDPTNVGDATKTVTIQNPVIFESDVAGAIDVTASQNVAAGNNVISAVDTVAGRDVTAARDMTAARDLAVSRNAVVAGTMAVAGALTAAVGGILAGAFAASGVGRFVNRHAVIGNPTTNETASVVTGSEYYWLTCTTNHTCTVSDADGIDGDVMEFSNNDTTAWVQIVWPRGAHELQLGAGLYSYLKIKKIAGHWQFLTKSPN